MAVTELSEANVAGGLQWLCFLLSWALFMFYCVQWKRQSCGWEGESKFLDPSLSAMAGHARARFLPKHARNDAMFSRGHPP